MGGIVTDNNKQVASQNVDAQGDDKSRMKNLLQNRVVGRGN